MQIGQVGPQVFEWKNEVTKVLDEIRFNYSKLIRKGYIYGLIAVDQDAKIIAIDSKFDRNLNYWDLASIGAALHGVARQGQDFFEADELERATLIYNNMQVFVRSIGNVQLTAEKSREILIVILADKDVNIGVILLQMQQFAAKIRILIENSNHVKIKLNMNETELKNYIQKVKETMVRGKVGSTP